MYAQEQVPLSAEHEHIEESTNAPAVPPAEHEHIEESTDAPAVGFVEYLSVGETVLHNHQSQSIELGVRLNAPVPLDSPELRAIETAIRKKAKLLLEPDSEELQLYRDCEKLRKQKRSLENGVNALEAQLEQAKRNWEAASAFLELHGIDPSHWAPTISVPQKAIPF